MCTFPVRLFLATVWLLAKQKLPPALFKEEAPARRRTRSVASEVWPGAGGEKQLRPLHQATFNGTARKQHRLAAGLRLARSQPAGTLSIGSLLQMLPLGGGGEQ